jgi:hypothetical protein
LFYEINILSLQENTIGMKRIRWFFPVFCCFFACQLYEIDYTDVQLNVCTGNCVQIKGKVMNAQAGQGLDKVRIEVILERESPSDPLCWSCFKEAIGSTTSDKDGYFQFSLPIDTMDANYSYTITLQRNQYFEKQVFVRNFSELKSMYEMKLYMIPSAKLKIMVTNQLSVQPNDEFGYSIEATLDPSLLNDSCDFPTYENFDESWHHRMPASTKSYTDSYDIPSPSVVKTFWWYMIMEGNHYNVLQRDSFPVSSFEYVEKKYTLK